MKEVEQFLEAVDTLSDNEKAQLASATLRVSSIYDHTKLIEELIVELSLSQKKKRFESGRTLDAIKKTIASTFNGFEHELETSVEEEKKALSQAVQTQLHNFEEIKQEYSKGNATASMTIQRIISEIKNEVSVEEKQMSAIEHLKEGIANYKLVNSELSQLLSAELELVKRTEALDFESATVDRIIQSWRELASKLPEVLRREIICLKHLKGLFEEKFHIGKLSHKYERRKGFFAFISGKGKITAEDIKRDCAAFTSAKDYNAYSAMMWEFSDLLTSDAKALLKSQGLISEIELRMSEGKLVSKMEFDQRTGLKSVLTLQDDFNKVTGSSQKASKEASFVLFDIDNFKNFNGYYGYNVANEVLFWIGTIIKKYKRENDIAIRWGGEELLLLLPNVKKDTAVKVAERIRAAIERESRELMNSINTRQSYSPQEEKYVSVDQVTVSAGVAEYPSEVKSLTDLERVAGDRLKAAKGSGRNKIIADSKIKVAV